MAQHRPASGACSESEPRHSASHSGLHRTLQARHMRMIAIGGVIGAGLFVGSGVVVQSAGPAAVLSFALTGTLVVVVMRMLGEMAAALPGVGGFYEYNRIALGDFAGYMTGWMYWYFWIIAIGIQAVAGSRILATWMPRVPPWQFTLLLMAGFTSLNLLSVRSWGEGEYWFASVKVVAIILFLLIGAVVIAGLWPHVPGGFTHLTTHGGFMPNGVTPVLTGAVAVTGFYFGAELVTVAAGESSEPERAVAQATQSVIWRVLVFYVGSILIVASLVPWNSTAILQPYVSALSVAHIPWARELMGVVILSAVLSTLNCGIFVASRTMVALAGRGEAPHSLGMLNNRGVPVRAVLIGTTFGYIAVIMSYLSPEHVFAFLIDSYGTVAIFVYVLIAFAQLRLRRRLEREAPDRLRVRVWLFPALTWCAIASMIAIVAAMAWVPDQRRPLLFGLISAVLMAGGYGLLLRSRATAFRRLNPH
jgi:GABA permease